MNFYLDLLALVRCFAFVSWLRKRTSRCVIVHFVVMHSFTVHNVALRTQLLACGLGAVAVCVSFFSSVVRACLFCSTVCASEYHSFAIELL